ncbi:MAG: hypothetical protein J6A42_04680 [Firmicutes bacterium]|nr:hypothetical protein [Bacillota bacterium]
MYRNRKFTFLLATLLVLSMLLAACSSNTSTETTEPAQTGTETPEATGDMYGGDLVVCNGYVSNTLDAHYSGKLTANYQWMRAIYEPAIIVGSDGKIYPLVCDYDYSDDGLTLKLTVKDRRFSNGEKITIEDVVASYERLAAIGGAFGESVMNYVEDMTIDGDTATITFNTFSPLFLTQLGDVRGPAYIMPKEICEKYGTEQITDTNDVIGSGAYVLETYNPDVEIKMVRNENYDIVEPGGPGAASPRHAYLDSIKYAMNTDQASETAGIIAGDYHVGDVLPAMQPYAEQLGIKRVPLYNQWTHAIFFNLSEDNKDSIVQNVNFRKAVRAALDMKAVALSIFNGDETRFYLDSSPIAKEAVDYYNDIIETTEWNIADKELARKYLAESGYDGEEVVLLASADTAFYRQAMAIIPQLEEIGINVRLWTVDSGSHSGLRADPASGFDIGSWENQKALANPLECVSMVTGTFGGWWTNDKKTELLDRMYASKTGSPESIEAYKEFCELLADEVPWIGFCTAITNKFTAGNLELNSEGTTTYYWNSYFVK